jgi:hypothetical protein
MLERISVFSNWRSGAIRSEGRIHEQDAGAERHSGAGVQKRLWLIARFRTMSLV